MTRVCKTCHKSVVRVLSGVDNRGYAKYKDTTGRQWRGRVCPTCNGVAQYKINSKRSFEYKLVKAVSKRTCKVCGQRLPLQYYFQHPECIQTEVSEQYPEFIYY